MKIVPRLRWYEWIGWIVDGLMIVGFALFISISLIEDETRPALIGLFVSLILVGGWTWVLLFYGREKKKGPGGDGGDAHGSD